MKLKATELKLADVVQVAPGAYGTATVSQVTETDVVFFRPYTQTADFSYTGGVICYIGIETFSVSKAHLEPFEVYRRQDLL